MCSTRSGLDRMAVVGVGAGVELSTLIDLFTEWGACWISWVFSENSARHNGSFEIKGRHFLKQSRKAMFSKTVKKSFDKQH